ncbi:sensor histidine kinase [Lysobacter yananisis]|uniref:histidine kinase n=1 Tax=Lysobacter yananisis TaxID=1003114 RepID=A0ABY9PC19_9GAMM|nr:sensor histidine kinase [Lysobacter yananisis]WMT03924.1 sensor histidine kinase [Lysobacter yananisis]
MLHELLANPIDNTIRCTPPGGRTEVEARRDGAAVRFAVADDGPGIAESERERVVERFVRGSKADSQGSGLGLAIAREIAALHGGALTLAASPHRRIPAACGSASPCPPPVRPPRAADPSSIFVARSSALALPGSRLLTHLRSRSLRMQAPTASQLRIAPRQSVSAIDFALRFAPRPHRQARRKFFSARANRGKIACKNDPMRST